MSFNRSSPTAQAWGERYGTILRSPDPAAIRAFLASESTVAAHVFLQLCVAIDDGDGNLRARWKRAARALADLETYTWGSKEKRAKFATIAADAELLAALQGAVARGNDVTLDMLGVLALDGGTESIDALLPHLDPALVAADVRLDLLKRLRKYAAPTSAIQAILGEVDEALAARAAASPALELGPVIGLGRLPILWFGVRISSRQLNASRVPSIQGSIRVDSRSVSWFQVWLTRVDALDEDSPSTSFTLDTVEDTLGVGRCDPSGIPRWLVSAAKTLRLELELGTPHTHLRGQKRARLMTWLRGG